MDGVPAPGDRMFETCSKTGADAFSRVAWTYASATRSQRACDLVWSFDRLSLRGFDAPVRGILSREPPLAIAKALTVRECFSTGPTAQRAGPFLAPVPVAAFSPTRLSEPQQDAPGLDRAEGGAFNQSRWPITSTANACSHNRSCQSNGLYQTASLFDDAATLRRFREGACTE